MKNYLKQIKLPKPDSHKGQNGKLLIIGGSELFHAASKWSLDIASRFVDMLFYSSVPDNNKLILEAKGKFWDGIVVPRGQVEEYIVEADCVLIGPGMTRSKETEKIVNNLLKKFSDKKWVIDAGALQMVDPKLLTSTCIVTPHRKEMVTLLNKCKIKNEKCQINDIKKFKHLEFIWHLELEFLNLQSRGITTLLKGPSDFIISNRGFVEVDSGNPGMTKGGSGDVLSGLVAALYCKHSAMTSSVVASYINKKTGDYLYKKVGTYFNTSDLARKLPQIFWQELDSEINPG